MTGSTSSETRPLSVIIYEGVEFVSCSPPALEYKSDKCLGTAHFVCHHCGSPLCKECAVIERDTKFPTFQRISRTKQPFIDIVKRIAAAILIFPVISFIKNFLPTQNIPTEFASRFRWGNFNFSILNVLIKFDKIGLYADLASIISIFLIASAMFLIFTTHMKIEETPEGKKKLSSYERYNLPAAHCKLCMEKYHKKKYLFKIFTVTFVIFALLIIYTQYQRNVIDLTFPIGLLIFARMYQKIEKPLLDVFTPPF